MLRHKNKWHGSLRWEVVFGVKEPFVLPHVAVFNPGNPQDKDVSSVNIRRSSDRVGGRDYRLCQNGHRQTKSKNSQSASTVYNWRVKDPHLVSNQVVEIKRTESRTKSLPLEKIEERSSLDRSGSQQTVQGVELSFVLLHRQLNTEDLDRRLPSLG